VNLVQRQRIDIHFIQAGKKVFVSSFWFKPWEANQFLPQNSKISPWDDQNAACKLDRGANQMPSQIDRSDF